MTQAISPPPKKEEKKDKYVMLTVADTSIVVRNKIGLNPQLHLV